MVKTWNMKILAFSGSNSRTSINQELIKYITQFLNVPVDIIDLRDYELPMFSIEEEQQNGHSNVLMSLYNTVIGYDAYIIAIPEHNGNYPAFFKNVLDWLTRVERSFFRGKPILLFNAAPGPNGGQSVLSIAEKSFPFFNGNIIGTFKLPEFSSFLMKGKIFIHDEGILNILKEQILKIENALNLKTVP
ncbi:hypothetical protein GCM10008083_27290 [Ulvibacter litoralis]|nr:hypothetical protein GCM10008083_27290 [Ulvibacter litoralis]